MHLHDFFESIGELPRSSLQESLEQMRRSVSRVSAKEFVV